MEGGGSRRALASVSAVVGIGVLVLTGARLALREAGPATGQFDQTTAVRSASHRYDPAENYQIYVPIQDADMEERLKAEDPLRSWVQGGTEVYGQEKRLSSQVVQDTADAGFGFSAFWPGPVVAGYPLQHLGRSHFVDELPGVADPPVVDEVSFSYGSCELSGGERPSCFLPLQVTVTGDRCPAGSLDERMMPGPGSGSAPIRRFTVRGVDVEQFRADGLGVVAYIGRQAVIVNFSDSAAVERVLAASGIPVQDDNLINEANAGGAVVRALRGIGPGPSGDIGIGDDLPARPAGLGTYTAGRCPKSRSSLKDQPFMHGPEWRVPPAS